MKIACGSLHEDEIFPLDHTYSPEREEVNFVDQRFIEPLHLVGEAIREDDWLIVTGTVTSVVERTCSRCLTVMRSTVSYPLKLRYDISEQKDVDITEEVRESAILDHPMRILCVPDCKGLCVHCGKNKNTESCQCGE